jgi:hypothetical protein
VAKIFHFLATFKVHPWIDLTAHEPAPKGQFGLGGSFTSHFAAHNGSCRIIQNARTRTLLITGLLVRFQHGAFFITIESTLLAKGDDFDEPKRGLSSFPPFKERNLIRRPWPGLPGLTAKPRPNCWDQRTQPPSRGSSRRRELLWTTGKAFCLRPVNSSRRKDRSIEPFFRSASQLRVLPRPPPRKIVTN